MLHVLLEHFPLLLLLLVLLLLTAAAAAAAAAAADKEEKKVRRKPGSRFAQTLSSTPVMAQMNVDENKHWHRMTAHEIAHKH